MARRPTDVSDTLYDYLLDTSLREPDVMRRLRERTAEHPQSEMQIAPDQGQFLAFLARLIGARRALEIGVFTGYSALAVARVLPPDGRLVACDVSAEYTAIGRPYWEEAGVADRIDLRIGPALDTLDALLDQGAAETFDFAFIDAAKEEYPGYYERTLRLLRPGGLMVLDNMFRGGRVADPDNDVPGVVAIRDLNARLHHDDRIDLSLLTVADGLTLARKRDRV